MPGEAEITHSGQLGLLIYYSEVLRNMVLAYLEYQEARL